MNLRLLETQQNANNKSRELRNTEYDVTIRILLLRAAQIKVIVSGDV